ncbi:ThuA domain-containing protein [Sphingomonas sp.]|uniref:ThuA domain-containing protein n=1 Tax=Sphingomonas sp. TaxID=28214 RepID=UPI003750BAF8
MAFIRYNTAISVLVVVGGHPFDRNSLAGLFEGMDGVAATFVDHPAAMQLMTVEGMRGFDALILYDVPGIDLRRGMAEQKPDVVAPTAEFCAAFLRLLDNGKGVLALHHAIAGWPAWEGYAEILGGRFAYLSGRLRGKDVVDSGYLQYVTYDAVVVEPQHPLTARLPPRFSLTDELYLFEVFHDSITPLLVADRRFRDADFFSAEAAVAHGRMHDNAGWSHAEGSNVLAWVKRAGNSPLVYVQPGDAAPTFADPNYRLLIENAVRWVSSDSARQWDGEAV